MPYSTWTLIPYMKYIKALLYSFKKSLVSVDYYSEILETKFSFSYKYFVGLSMIIAFIYAGSFMAFDANRITDKINLTLQEVSKFYPDSLVITSVDGVITTNMEDPYIIKTPDYIKESGLSYETEQNTKFPDNLIVFDKKGTIDDMEKYNTMILINSTNILVKDPSKIQTRPTRNVPDFMLDKNKVEEKIQNLKKLTYIIPTVGLFVVLGISFVFYISIKFLDALFSAVVVFIISSVIKTGYSFMDTLKIVLHTTTLPYILESFIIILKPNVPNYQSILFVINIGLAIFVIYKLNKKGLTHKNTEVQQTQNL